MTILLKMWFSASEKMDDVSVWNRIVYFVNARGINFFFSPAISYEEHLAKCSIHLPEWAIKMYFFDTNDAATKTGQDLSQFQEHAWVWIIQNLVWHNFSISFLISLSWLLFSWGKLYACIFNAKNTKQHTFFLAVCSYVSEYTLIDTKYRSNTAMSSLHWMLPQAALLTRLTQAGEIR